MHHSCYFRKQRRYATPAARVSSLEMPPSPSALPPLPVSGYLLLLLLYRALPDADSLCVTPMRHSCCFRKRRRYATPAARVSNLVTPPSPSSLPSHPLCCIADFTLITPFITCRRLHFFTPICPFRVLLGSGPFTQRRPCAFPIWRCNRRSQLCRRRLIYGYIVLLLLYRALPDADSLTHMRPYLDVSGSGPTSQR